MLNTTFPSWVVAKRGSKLTELLTKHSKTTYNLKNTNIWDHKDDNKLLFRMPLVT